MSVLFVQNDSGLRSLNGEIMDFLGYKYDLAAIESEAYDCLHRAECAYSLCLIDVDTPGMNGFEVVAQFHRHHADLPIVAITSRRYSKGECAEAGLSGLLYKPYNIEDLRTTLEAYCGVQRRGERAQAAAVGNSDSGQDAVLQGTAGG